MEIKFTKLHWFPWIFVCTLTFSVMILYAWSVLVGDVPVFLPYVSDAGGNAPQSALFGIALLTCAFSGAPPFLVRFFSVRAVENQSKIITLLNYLALLCAVLACLGLIMVGTNPVSHLRRDGTWLLPVLIPHMIGAVLTFLFTTVYFGIQTCFAWILGRRYKKPMVGYTRLACMAATIGGTLTMAVFAPLYNVEDFKPNPDHGTTYRGTAPWSAVGEWVLIIGLMCNILTLVPDMKSVRVTIHIENVEDVADKDVNVEKDANNEMMKL